MPKKLGKFGHSMRDLKAPSMKDFKAPSMKDLRAKSMKDLKAPSMKDLSGKIKASIKDVVGDKSSSHSPLPSLAERNGSADSALDDNATNATNATTSTPQHSNRTNRAEYLISSSNFPPAPPYHSTGIDVDDYIIESSDEDNDDDGGSYSQDEGLTPMQISQAMVGVESDDDGDSIMGMSTENELGEIGGKAIRKTSSADEYIDDVLSAVSDDDYYKQDYYMLGTSDLKEEEEENDVESSPDVDPDTNITSLSERILDEMSNHADGEGMASAEGGGALGESDGPGERVGANDKGGDDDVDNDNNSNNNNNNNHTPVDGQSNFETLMQKWKSEEGGSSSSAPALPRDVVSRKEGHGADNSGGVSNSYVGDVSADQITHDNDGGTISTCTPRDMPPQDAMNENIDASAGLAQNPPNIKDIDSSSSQLDETVTTIRLLVEETSAGRSAEELLASYEGREDELLKFLKKLKRSKLREDEWSKSSSGTGREAGGSIGMSSVNSNGDDGRKSPGESVDALPVASGDEVPSQAMEIDRNENDDERKLSQESVIALQKDDNNNNKDKDSRSNFTKALEHADSEKEFNDFESMLKRATLSDGGKPSENETARLGSGGGNRPESPIGNDFAAALKRATHSESGVSKQVARPDSANSNDSDFAASLKQATRPDSANSNNSDFTAALKQATLPDSANSNDSDFAAVLKRATHSSAAEEDGVGGEDDSSRAEIKSQNSFAGLLKQATTKLRPSEPTIGAVSEEGGAPSIPVVAKIDEVRPQSPAVDKSEEALGILLTPPKVDQRGIVDNMSQVLVASAPMSPGDSMASPSSTTLTALSPSEKTVEKLAKENHKLRKRRKELLKALSSTAQQFSSYEKVCTKKISQLEERNRQLEQNPEERAGLELASSVAKDLNNSNSQLNSSAKKYDGEIVRRLSNGVLTQEKQLKSKDDLITQLKLRCEVLKQSLVDKDEEILNEKNLWEEERTKLLKKLDSDSPKQDNQGELMSTKMECTRIKKDLETASGDITMLTTALETNNESLDAAVSELNKLKAWKAEYGEAASEVAAPLDITHATGTEKLRSELKEKEQETMQLQKDLESSLNEIERLRESVNTAASATGYNEFQDVVEDLKNEANVSRKDADLAKERIKQLESELESKKGEMDKLRSTSSQAISSQDGQLQNGSGASSTNPSTAATAADVSHSTIDERSVAPPSPMIGVGKRLGMVRRAFVAAAAPQTATHFARGSSVTNQEEEPADYPALLKQRDLKVKSLDAMMHSYLRIIDKMKIDVEKMDSQKEEAEYTFLRRIEQLEEENKTYQIQVMGFEKAFMALNEQRGSISTPSKSAQQQEDESIVDDHLWDECDDDSRSDADVRSENLTLQRMVTELESSSSFQEDQIETLKAELIKLRVKSQQEKETALARMAEENEIVVAQRSALENQLVEINRQAGTLRESLDSGNAHLASGDGGGGGIRASGSDAAFVTQVVMLEKANKVLESSVESLRSGMQEKLAPLLERIALLEEEKRIVEEEMNTKLSCRELTITNLEKQLHKGGHRKLKFSKKKGIKLSSIPSLSAAPDRAAGGH